MRAVDIVIFWVCFNAGFFIIDALGVFGTVGPQGRILTVGGSLAVAVLAIAITAASITILGTRVTRPIGVIAVAFAGLYAFLVVNAMAIVYEITLGGVGVTAALLLALGALNAVIFAIGMIQLVTGGMRGGR